jgi:hypothetical protein
MKKRGGRAAVERLKADLHIIRATARNLREHPSGLRSIEREAHDIQEYSINVRLVEDAAARILRLLPSLLRQIEETTDDIMAVTDDLSAYIDDKLDPLLERVDARTAVRDEDLEKRVIALEIRIAELELERRGVVPIRRAKEGGG